MTDLFTHLREHCRIPHDALHVHPLLQPLHDGPITTSHYEKVIGAFHLAYAEPEKIKPSTTLPDNPVSVWLAEDMALLRVNAPTPPLLHDMPLNNLSSLVGYLYVKQGSSLGGQLISRQLADQLGIGPGTGNSFFYGEGKQTGGRWQQFKREVLSLPTPVDYTIAGRTALHMFENIRVCCDHVLGLHHEITPSADGKAITRGA